MCNIKKIKINKMFSKDRFKSVINIEYLKPILVIFIVGSFVILLFCAYFNATFESWTFESWTQIVQLFPFDF